MRTGKSETRHPALANPYVGPRAFEENESQFFFGRDQEIEILTGLVLSRRAALFFAQSGAGKSSLLRAGLIPELTRQESIGRGHRARSVQKMHVLPIVTVGGAIPSEMSQPVANVYVLSALLSLAPDAAPDDLANLTLAEGLAPFFALPEPDPTDPTSPPPPSSSSLLIFDQFEELFTHHPTQRPQREALFHQVCQALETFPGLHVLFTMREDFIAELTPYAGLLPEGLRPRFRLERLAPSAALLAVQQPAEKAGRPFAEGVAEALVDNLRRLQPGRGAPDLEPGTAALELGSYVEPVHLQIVCRQLWASLPPEGTTILAEDVQAFGDVDQALADFYETALQQVLEHSDVSERRLRTWFDERLITPARTRGLAYRGAQETEGLPNAAVAILNNAYIIRANIRGRDTWYELAHDRLVEPILAANREWQTKYHNPLAAATRSWLEAGRAPRGLFRGAQLEDAQTYVQQHPEDVLQEEKEFLAASLRAEATEQEQARQAATLRRIGFSVAAVLIVLFASLAGWALRQRATANTARATAEIANANADAARATAEIANANADAIRTTAEVAIAAVATANAANATAAVAIAMATVDVRQGAAAEAAVATAEVANAIADAAIEQKATADAERSLGATVEAERNIAATAEAANATADAANATTTADIAQQLAAEAANATARAANATATAASAQNATAAAERSIAATAAAADATATAVGAQTATAAAERSIAATSAAANATATSANATAAADVRQNVTAVAAGATAVSANATATSASAQRATAQIAETVVAAVGTATPISAGCLIVPEGDFAGLWRDRYQDRLGCPKRISPTGGLWAEQVFDRGRMYWSEILNWQFAILAPDKDPFTWLLTRENWDDNYRDDCDKRPCQAKPSIVRGFGSWWCTDERLQRAVGCPEEEEHQVHENLIQEFDKGFILRGADRSIIVLFTDDDDGITAQGRWEPAN